MDQLDFLLGEYEEETGVYIEFLCSYKKNHIYAYVEGKDDVPYYRSVIEHHITSNMPVNVIGMGGKKYVKELYEKIDWLNYDEKQITFYIDRDYSDYLKESLPIGPNVYITDEYSLENTIINDDTFIRYICDHMGIIDMEEHVIQGLKDNFITTLDEYHSLFIPITTMILHWKKCNISLNLKNVVLDKFFSFMLNENGSAILLKYKCDTKEDMIKKLAGQCGIAKIQSLRDFQISIENDLKENNCFKKLLRGKFLSWFFVKYIDCVTNNSLQILGIEKCSSNITLGVSNAVAVLVSKAKPCVSLREFIQLMPAKYILKDEAMV